MLSNTDKLPTLPTNPTVSDMNAFMSVMSKNVEILTIISNDLKTLEDIKLECAATKTILQHTLIGEIVDAAIVNKQLDLTNDTSKLSRLVSESNLGIKEMKNYLPSMSENISKIKEHLWKFAVAIGLVITLTGSVNVYKNLNEIDKNQTLYGPVKKEQFPIYNFTKDGQAYLISLTGDTLWISLKKPDLIK